MARTPTRKSRTAPEAGGGRTLRIGSLFTGTGALDLAVMDIFDAQAVWHAQYEPPDKKGKEDKNQYAAQILARHWPTVPNLGDITKVDWRAVLDERGPVDIVTGGFPCTDVSSAGRRAGLTPDTRSGLWSHMAYAVSVLQPRLVIIENVEGLLSAPADRGLGLDTEALEEEARAGRILRALGAVLGDLASLGFDAEWARVAASEVGAPHGRKRVFVYAWPADADPADLGHQRGGRARDRRHGPADRGLSPADPESVARRLDDGDDVRAGRRTDRLGQAAGRREAAPHARCVLPGNDGELPAGRDAVQRGVRDDAPRCGTSPAYPNERGRRADVLQLRPGQPDLDWGDYEPAIRRWEAVCGRPAPWPTDALGRLSAVFTEWLMGLPDGWVTNTPGLTRAAMLRALGNGVVPRQATAAIRLLAERAAVVA